MNYQNILPGTFIRRLSRFLAEMAYQSSRFDFSFKTGHRYNYMAVKGVTLEQDGRALFPDAPTKRGIKHLEELASAAFCPIDCQVRGNGLNIDRPVAVEL